MYAMGPHSTYLYDDKSLCAVGSVCKRFHVPMHIHMQETKSELENSVAGNHEGANCHRSDQKCSPIANLARLGLLDGTICAHCVHVLDSDIALLQKHGASAVHCPRSNLKLGSGLAPVQRMLDTGVNVCLGTDGASSNNSLDMLSELRTAALIAPIAADGDATAVTAVTAIGTAVRHIFFTAERHMAISTFPTFYNNFRSICKHGKSLCLSVTCSLFHRFRSGCRYKSF